MTDTVESWVARARQARGRADLAEAAHCYAQALRLAPSQHELRLDAAAASLGAGDAAGALATLEASPATGAAWADPQVPHTLLPGWRAELIAAMALARLGRADDALPAFQRALAHRQTPQAAVHTARREAAQLLLNELGDPQGAADLHASAEQQPQAWQPGEPDAANRRVPLHEDEQAWLAVLVTGLYTGKVDSPTLSASFRRFAARHLEPPGGAAAPAHWPPRATRASGAPPRIGWVCGMFCSSPVGFMTLGVFEALAQQAELVCFDRGSKHDWAHARFRRSASAWHDVRGLGPVELARAITDAGLDAIVDLCGWMDLDVMRALARRPAPRQFKWVGGQALTTGLNCFDGFWADKAQVPDSARDLYCEPILHFEGGYAAYTSPPYLDLSVAAAAPPAPALAASGAYAIVSNPAKIGAPMRPMLDALRPKVLHLVDARWRHRHARERAAALLGPWAAVARFVAPVNHPAYLQTLSDLDATVLDTEPYSMGLTAIELRLLGKPILARPRAPRLTLRERHCVAHLGTPRFDRHSEMAAQVLAWCRP